MPAHIPAIARQPKFFCVRIGFAADYRQLIRLHWRSIIVRWISASVRECRTVDNIVYMLYIDDGYSFYRTRAVTNGKYLEKKMTNIYTYICLIRVILIDLTG